MATVTKSEEAGSEYRNKSYGSQAIADYCRGVRDPYQTGSVTEQRAGRAETRTSIPLVLLLFLAT